MSFFLFVCLCDISLVGAYEGNENKSKNMTIFLKNRPYDAKKNRAAGAGEAFELDPHCRDLPTYLVARQACGTTILGSPHTFFSIDAWLPSRPSLFGRETWFPKGLYSKPGTRYITYNPFDTRYY